MKNQLHTFSIRSKFIVKRPDDDDDDGKRDDVEFIEEDDDGVSWEGCECRYVTVLRQEKIKEALPRMDFP